MRGRKPFTPEAIAAVRDRLRELATDIDGLLVNMDLCKQKVLEVDAGDAMNRGLEHTKRWIQKLAAEQEFQAWRDKTGGKKAKRPSSRT